VTVNAAGFDVCAILVVGGCLVTVLGRSVRLTLLGAVATILATALLLLITAADLLAILLLLGLLGSTAALVLGGRRGAFGADVAPLAWGPLPLGIVAAVATAIVIDGTVLVSDSAFHRGGQSASLGALFHYRAPVTAGLILVALVITAAFALLLGRTARDEILASEAKRAREERQQRMHRRRQDRAAAREQRRATRSAGG
jgi:hypothetical protein